MIDQRAGSTVAGLTGPGEVSSYEKWARSQGIELVHAYGGTDLRTIAEQRLTPWGRMGGRGALFVNPDTWKGMIDGYILELGAGEVSEPERHLFEEFVYVMEGSGTTSVRSGQGDVSVAWEQDDYFRLPLNVSYRHMAKEGRARLLGITTAPLILNYFHNEEFVFQNPFRFDDRWDGSPTAFDPDQVRRYWSEKSRCDVMEGNFFRGLPDLTLPPSSVRSGEGTRAFFEGGGSALTSHCLEWSEGMYSKAHRHLAGGWFGVILKGRGFSLAWKEDSPYWSKATDRHRYDWQELSVLGYPDPRFHQHFNTGRGPARYLAVHFVSQRFPGVGWDNAWRATRSTKEGGDQIEYDDEDPAILEMFKDEIRAQEVSLKPLSEWRD